VQAVSPGNQARTSAWHEPATKTCPPLELDAGESLRDSSPSTQASRDGWLVQSNSAGVSKPTHTLTPNCLLGALNPEDAENRLTTQVSCSMPERRARGFPVHTGHLMPGASPFIPWQAQTMPGRDGGPATVGNMDARTHQARRARCCCCRPCVRVASAHSDFPVARHSRWSLHRGHMARV